MNSKKAIILPLVVFLSLANHALADSRSRLTKEEALEKALVEFRSGSYAQALEILSHVKKSQDDDTAIVYWRGVCESKLQHYDIAIRKLQFVLQHDISKEFDDAAYLLGQAYYATQQFQKANAAFEESVARKYKIAASLYYEGYTQELLNRSDASLKAFEQVIELPDSEPEMKQAAQFQVGEVFYQKSLKIKDKLRKDSILSAEAAPAYEKAIALNPEGPLAIQARGRLDEIARLEGPKVARTKSGVPKPAKAWVIKLGEEIKYDTNLINQPDDTLIKVSNAGSPLNKTSVYGKYEYVAANWIAITPELSSDYSYDWIRTPVVAQNDAFNLNPAIRTRFDHKINDKAAAGLFEYEFGYQRRDYEEIKNLLYYDMYNNFVLGERAELLNYGNTTLKFNLKLYQNVDTNQNYVGPGVSLGQNWKINQYILNTTLGFENQAANNPFYDQRNYKFNSSFGLPNFYWNTNLDLSFAVVIVDTENQSATRGTEKEIEPGFTLTKFLDSENHWTATFSYNYTDYISLDKANYAYTKNVVALGVQYTF